MSHDSPSTLKPFSRPLLSGGCIMIEEDERRPSQKSAGRRFSTEHRGIIFPPPTGECRPGKCRFMQRFRDRLYPRPTTVLNSLARRFAINYLSIFCCELIYRPGTHIARSDISSVALCLFSRVIDLALWATIPVFDAMAVELGLQVFI